MAVSMAASLETPEGDKVNAFTERVAKLKREWQEATPYISSQVSHSLTTSWKTTEGQPIDLRQAKAHAKILAPSNPPTPPQDLLAATRSMYDPTGSVLMLQRWKQEAVATAEKGGE